MECTRFYKLHSRFLLFLLYTLQTHRYNYCSCFFHKLFNAPADCTTNSVIYGICRYLSDLLYNLPTLFNLSTSFHNFNQWQVRCCLWCNLRYSECSCNLQCNLPHIVGPPHLWKRLENFRLMKNRLYPSKPSYTLVGSILCIV